MNLIKRHGYVLLATIFFIAMAVPFLRKTDSQWDNVYRGAAQRLLAGEDLFRLQDGYLYPPFMAWLAIPFAYLPTDGARVAWYAINVLATVVLWTLAWKLSGGQALGALTRSSWKEHLILGLGLLAAGRYAIDCLQNQQTDLVIASLLLIGCWALTRSRILLAATMFGLAAGMKCTALLWCPYLLWRRQWLAATWVAVVAIGVNLLPNLASTPASDNWWLAEWAERYLMLLTRADHAPGIWGSSLVLNQSWSGAAYRWFMTTWEWTSSGVQIVERTDALTPKTLKLVVYGASALAIAACAWIMGRSQARGTRTGGALHQAHPAPLGPHRAMGDESGSMRRRRLPMGATDTASLAWESSIVLMLMVLLSPMSSKPHFVTLVLPALLLARQVVLHRQPIATLGLSMATFSVLLSAKDVAGVNLATIVMWLGGVSFAAFSLLVGCCSQVGNVRWRESALAAKLPAEQVNVAA